MIRAGVYVRISQDRAGAGLGVARQETDCRVLCDRKGWAVAEVYSDNDLSAYSGRPRPEWQRLVADANGGRVDAIAVWHVDRLTRSPRELEDIIDLADRHGLSLATVTGEVDLATPTGKMVARIMGAAARHESEHKAARQRAERRQAAEQGRAAGGGLRPYGYAHNRITVVEEEAQVIRECAGRVLAGESLNSVCRDLEKRNVRTSLGNRWQASTLRKMLASARISGQREHIPSNTYKGTRPLIGEIVADAEWPAIVAPADSDRLRRLLSDPTRRSVRGGRSYLLSGILRCGLCDAGLAGRPREDGQRRYVCTANPGTGSCGRIAIKADFADQVVRDMVLVALESKEFRDRLNARAKVDPAIRKAVADDEEQLEELAAEFGERRITSREWRIAREITQARLDQNQRTLDRATDTASLKGMTGSYDELLAKWEQRNLSQRRAMVADVLVRVVVRSAARNLDHDRLEPEFRA